jgi:hypothetical protein
MDRKFQFEMAKVKKQEQTSRSDFSFLGDRLRLRSFFDALLPLSLSFSRSLSFFSSLRLPRSGRSFSSFLLVSLSFSLFLLLLLSFSLADERSRDRLLRCCFFLPSFRSDERFRERDRRRLDERFLGLRLRLRRVRERDRRLERERRLRE